jgi:hypothetical protein
MRAHCANGKAKACIALLTPHNTPVPRAPSSGVASCAPPSFYTRVPLLSFIDFGKFTDGSEAKTKTQPLMHAIDRNVSLLIGQLSLPPPPALRLLPEDGNTARSDGWAKGAIRNQKSP